jgi:helix-turn-helix protein
MFGVRVERAAGVQDDRLCADDRRYCSRRSPDTELRERLRALAHERRRFGYRRLLVLLRREGFIVNHKRLFRIYREERLMVRRRGGRKRALGTRAPMLVPQLPNDRWSRLGWMIYAADRRSAALRSTDGSAPRTAVITAQQGNTDRQTPTATG